MPSWAVAASPGVKATWTRISALRYLRGHRADQDVLLPAPEPGDRRVLLGMRAWNLSRLHGLRAGRDPLPRPRGPCAGQRATDDPGRATPLLRGPGRARDQDPDRDQRRRLPDQPRAGLVARTGAGKPVREGGVVRPGRARPGRMVALD